MNLNSVMLDSILPSTTQQKKTAVQPAQVTFKPHVPASSSKPSAPEPAVQQKQQAQHQRTQMMLRKQRESEQAKNEDNARARQEDADFFGAGGGIWLPDGSRSDSGQGQGEEQREDENSAIGMTGKARSSAELDAEELAAILPMGDCNGIFDVTLPGGESLGVVVNANAKKATFMLTPGSEKTSANLIRNQKELNECLERRIKRDVQLIIL